MATFAEVTTELRQYFLQKGSNGVTTQEVVAFMVDRKIVVGEVMNLALTTIGAEKTRDKYYLLQTTLPSEMGRGVDEWVKSVKKPSAPLNLKTKRTRG